LGVVFAAVVADAAVVVGSPVAMDGVVAVVGLEVTSAMGSAPDQSLIIALLRGSDSFCAGLKARFINFRPEGCGGLFACQRNVDRKEAPGFIFVRRHRTTACRP
jgi:hypothetical protein